MRSGEPKTCRPSITSVPVIVANRSVSQVGPREWEERGREHVISRVAIDPRGCKTQSLNHFKLICNVSSRTHLDATRLQLERCALLERLETTQGTLLALRNAFGDAITGESRRATSDFIAVRPSGPVRDSSPLRVVPASCNRSRDSHAASESIRVDVFFLPLRHNGSINYSNSQVTFPESQLEADHVLLHTSSARPSSLSSVRSPCRSFE